MAMLELMFGNMMCDCQKRGCGHGCQCGV